MAVIQSRGVNVADPTTTAALTFTGAVTAGSVLLACLYYNNGTTPPSATPPAGWTIMATDQTYASAMYGQVFTKVADGSETGISITLPAASIYALCIVEASSGAQLDFASGETDDSGTAINGTAIDTEVGADVFGFFWQQAFGAVLTSTDTLVVYGDATNTRAMVTHRVADAATEAMSAVSSQGGFAGWIAVSFAAAGPGEPDVVEGTGGLSGAGSLSASGVALAAGTYALNAAGALSFTPDLPVGGFLRLLGVSSGTACWVEVSGFEGAASAPDVIYVVDAQQAGDDSLAALVDAEQAATGTVEVRHYS
jgi:hypothetical protein